MGIFIGLGIAAVVVTLVTFIFACCKASSWNSRRYEERDL